MLTISPEDEDFLFRSLELGETLLILGAGSSASCTNRQGQPVKSADQLAAALAKRAGLAYDKETLSEVLGAVKTQFLSEIQIRQILEQEYRGIQPSLELKKLFTISWNRVYTWNIDDTLENLSGHSAQQRRFYNGLIDKVAEHEGPQHLHVVYLHGQITKPEHGFILSESDYAGQIRNEKLYWYKQAAQDYLAYTPIFIGSKLNEPILQAHLELAKRDGGLSTGRSYLIVPETLSEIKRASLKSKGIIHLQGSLFDFVRWLEQKFTNGLTPEHVLANSNQFPDAERLRSLTRDELDSANSLRPVYISKIKTALHAMASPELNLIARRFLRGFPPNWTIAASEIPVWLRSTDDLYRSLSKSISDGNKLFVVIGQSGSGKTTAAMMSLLRYAAENPSVNIYEVIGDVKSLRRTLNLLKKLHDTQSVVFVGDMFLYGDGFKEDLEQLSGLNTVVVTTARSGEWREHFVRHLGALCRPFTFERFVRADYAPLIERLIKFVPAPTFRKLSTNEQGEKLAASKSQLLIALREATESQNFTDVITNEYERLPDADTKSLFMIAGLGTLARVGINLEMAHEIYEQTHISRSFDDALNALEGIVSLSEGRRLFARHELYVRHVIENLVDYSQFGGGIKNILRAFCKYEIPIIRSVNRRDAILFKFLVNHNFIFENAKKHEALAQGKSIYEAFEIDFQLDGHYWLQYALYLTRLREFDEALKMMKRSIQAYPANAFAVHALADLQLRIAIQRPTYDAITKRLIDEAVETLHRQDAQRLDIDQYPIATLAFGHIEALIKHGQESDARRYAKQYFDRVQQLEKQIPVPILKQAKESLLRYVTYGYWNQAENPLFRV